MRQKDLDLVRRDRASLLHSRDYYSISDEIFQNCQDSSLFGCTQNMHTLGSELNLLNHIKSY